jgi:hypothetical protein
MFRPVCQMGIEATSKICHALFRIKQKNVVFTLPVPGRQCEFPLSALFLGK